MTVHSLSTHLRTVNQQVIIDLGGEINGLAEQELSEAFQSALDQNPNAIIFNFSSVNYINSTGIALIVGLLAEARKSHITLAVYGLSEHYQELFTITRISDFMKIYPDEESAIQS
jgi:anti-anti-sigma factor